MKRVLFDTNIVLDVLLAREPHVSASSAAWAIVENRRAQGILAGHAVTTIYYILRKQLGDPRTRQILTALLGVFEVAAVNKEVIEKAFSLSGGDFEDAVVAIAAQASQCDFIVTRDPSGFRDSPVPTIRPEGFSALYELS